MSFKPCARRGVAVAVVPTKLAVMRWAKIGMGVRAGRHSNLLTVTVYCCSIVLLWRHPELQQYSVHPPCMVCRPTKARDAQATPSLTARSTPPPSVFHRPVSSLALALGRRGRLFSLSRPPSVRRQRALLALSGYLFMACLALCVVEKWTAIEAAYYATASLTTVR